MISTTATFARRTALLRQQVHDLRAARHVAARPPMSSVELASAAGITLDAWQARALETDERNIILLASRQSGKSLTAGVAALHEATTVPGSLTLIVSPSERQSKRLLRSIRRLYQRLPETVPARHLGILSIELANGSEIHALPGSEETIRGFSAVNLLILDEGSRIEDSLYESVRPMLAISNGKLMALSTPFGRRGWYYQEWTTGVGWHRERIVASECPRIDPGWLALERDRIGAWSFQQEYDCIFVDTEDQLFSHELVEGAMSTDFPPLFERQAA